MIPELNIPYTKYDNYNIVTAYTNGFKGNFIIDLNYKCSTLNKAYFRFNKNEQVKKKGRKQGVTISRFYLYGITLTDKTFNLENLTKYEQKGKPILGIISQDIFCDKKVEINEKKKIIRVTG